MIELPYSEKWVARYKDSEGKDTMGLANHHGALPPLVAAILNSGGHSIVITDETIRPRIIDGKIEIINEEVGLIEHHE